MRARAPHLRIPARCPLFAFGLRRGRVHQSGIAGSEQEDMVHQTALTEKEHAGTGHRNLRVLREISIALSQRRGQPAEDND